MIARIPPLWRDADAYVQLTQDPRAATFWGHAPAYCYVAKVPLFVGEQWERIRGQPPVPRINENQPALTDSGIWLLVVAQHLALGLAAFRFIAAVSIHFWVRLALVLAWASNAMTYTFAHCVGSETLGMILTIALATKGLRLIQNHEGLNWKQWYGFAAILLLSILARDLNLALIALLPLAFLLSWILKKIRKTRDADRALALRSAGIAIAIGLACPLLAESLKMDLARKTRLHPHSRIGYTFLWRLHLLDNLSPESRGDLLQKARSRAPTERVRYLVSLLEQLQTESIRLPRGMDRAIFHFGGPFHWEDLDRSLNQMAFTFLWPPPAELLQAARVDFIRGMTTPGTSISEYLFATTIYYFGNKEELRACGRLVTFRDKSPEQIMPLAHRPYFSLWQGVSYFHVFALWFASAFLFLVVAKRRRQAGDFMAYAVALLLAGLAQFVAACVLHDYEPRFSLAMWLLLLCSLFVLIGRLAREISARQDTPA